ncbi:unnamed protein product [Arctogadus glacialis]
MDELDAATVSTLRAANISEEMVSTLSREDLRDLFPGPENFLRRKRSGESVMVFQKRKLAEKTQNQRVLLLLMGHPYLRHPLQ